MKALIEEIGIQLIVYLECAALFHITRTNHRQRGMAVEDTVLLCNGNGKSGQIFSTSVPTRGQMSLSVRVETESWLGCTSISDANGYWYMELPGVVDGMRITKALFDNPIT